MRPHLRLRHRQTWVDPPPAMALATARGAADRVLPGVAVGLLGYAMGNYTGFAMGMLVRGALGY